MGIVSALLTGGILIGKICQAIGGGLFAKESSGSAMAVSGDVSAGGVVFFRSNVSGPSLTYAYNPSTKSAASVVVPNGTDGGGVTYVIQPTEKIPFAEAESPLVPPSTTVTTGLTNINTTLAGADLAMAPGGSFFKLAFAGLRLGHTARVGSFTLTCTTAQLIIASSQITLTGLTYMYLISDKGVAASSTATIPKDPTPPSDSQLAPSDASFSIDFSALGINMAVDTLDGNLTLSLNASAKELSALSKVPSEPLHPVEREALKKYDYLA